MKFALNDDQSALADATRDFFASKTSSDKTRSAFLAPKGFDEDLFSSMCDDLGLAALIVSEQDGGLGASDVELAVVLEQHGYFLAASPFRTHVSSIIAVQECADEENRKSHLEKLATGESLAAAIFGDEDHSIVVDSNEGEYRVSGRFARVPFGATLQNLYFPIEIDGGVKLAHLEIDQDSVSALPTPSIDQTQPLGAIECENSIVSIISGEVSDSFSRARSRAIVAACNEMVGSTQAVLDMSVAYAKDRVQFGRPIGSFQAIKHKCAEMLLETESARSISLFGAWLASQGSDFSSDEIEDDLDHIASMAKYYASKAFNHAAGENIQIHGGIGFTMEHDAQLYFKRAAFMNAHLGLPHEHASRIGKELMKRSELVGN